MNEVFDRDVVGAVLSITARIRNRRGLKLVIRLFLYSFMSKVVKHYRMVCYCVSLYELMLDLFDFVRNDGLCCYICSK